MKWRYGFFLTKIGKPVHGFRTLGIFELRVINFSFAPSELRNDEGFYWGRGEHDCSKDIHTGVIQPHWELGEILTPLLKHVSLFLVQFHCMEGIAHEGDRCYGGILLLLLLLVVPFLLLRGGVAVASARSKKEVE